MKHLLILLSLLLLSAPLFGQSIVTKQIEETCYVSVDGSKEFNLNLFSQISKSLISQFFKPVKNIPPGGISSDSCVYEITVTKEGDTTFVVFSGEDLNSYGDSKLSGADGFQQSVLKSLHRALKDKRTLICEDYGEFLSKECSSIKKEMVMGKSSQGVLYRSRKGGWTINEEENTDRKYVGEIKNGRPNGQGTVTRNDGKTYVGEFREGRLNGQGTVTWSDGRKIVGEWKNGKVWNIKKYNKKGKRVGVWIKGKRKIQSKLEEISDSTVLYRSRKGGWTIEKNKNSDRVYKGQIKNGLPHGKGETIVWKNRLKMIGEFKRGKPWNTNLFNSKGKKVGVWLNGVKQ